MTSSCSRWSGSGEDGFPTWYIPREADRAQAIGDLTRRMIRVGKVEKLYSDEFAWIRLDFGPHVQLAISTMRKTICERVVVGKKVIPAQPERTIAATPEQTVEEVEWRCHPVLTAGSSHTIEGEAKNWNRLTRCSWKQKQADAVLTLRSVLESREMLKREEEWLSM